MYKPTTEEYSKAKEIVCCFYEESAVLKSEEDIENDVQKIMDIAYSLGGSYNEDYLKEIVTTVLSAESRYIYE